ncbi:MAG: hypothetical protein MI923_00535 [Phycisphaerales bacterium]|nr:hypothetical protein [Phycisphaerales bacterium]
MIHELDYASGRLSHVERVKAVAEQQRNLKIIVMVLFGGIVLLLGIPMMVIPLLGVGIYSFVVLYRLLVAMETKPIWIMASLLGVLVPLVQVLVFITINYKACEILRAAGLKIAFTGVHEDDLERFAQEQC